jgi:hypothetical protein
MRLSLMAIVGLSMASSMLGCTSREQETPPMQTRAAENVSPEMRDRALKGLHSEDARLQLEGLRFLESFPEVKQHQLSRVEELAKGSKDPKVRSQAAKILE